MWFNLARSIGGKDTKIQTDKLNKVLSKLQVQEVFKLYKICINQSYQNC